MEIINLILRNKVVEIINWFYDTWHECIVYKYIVIWIIGFIPGTAMCYLWFANHNAHNESIGVILFVSFAFWMFIIAALCVIHLTVDVVRNWIKENIRLAKEGTKVQPRWKEKL